MYDNGADRDFYIKGLDGKRLTTEGTSINMGEGNRGFIFDYPYDDDTYWNYYHQYLGGTLSFDVNVNDVGCGCAAGVFLGSLDDENCSWDKWGMGSKRTCPTIDLLQANGDDFLTAAHPCAGGQCDAVSQCIRTAPSNGYGPGSSYTIDTTRSFSATYTFWADTNAAVTSFTGLNRIAVTLTQDGRLVEMVLDC